MFINQLSMHFLEIECHDLCKGVKCLSVTEIIDKHMDVTVKC